MFKAECCAWIQGDKLEFSRTTAFKASLCGISFPAPTSAVRAVEGAAWFVMEWSFHVVISVAYSAASSSGNPSVMASRRKYSHSSDCSRCFCVIGSQPSGMMRTSGSWRCRLHCRAIRHCAPLRWVVTSNPPLLIMLTATNSMPGGIAGLNALGLTMTVTRPSLRACARLICFCICICFSFGCDSERFGVKSFSHPVAWL